MNLPCSTFVPRLPFSLPLASFFLIIQIQHFSFRQPSKNFVFGLSFAAGTVAMVYYLHRRYSRSQALMSTVASIQRSLEQSQHFLTLMVYLFQLSFCLLVVAIPGESEATALKKLILVSSFYHISPVVEVCLDQLRNICWFSLVFYFLFFFRRPSPRFFFYKQIRKFDNGL